MDTSTNLSTWLFF